MRRTSALFALILTVPVVACGDDSIDPGDGDGFEPADAIGTYALDPNPAMTCDLGAFGDITLEIASVDVTNATADSIYLSVPVQASGDILPDMEFETAFALGLDPQTGEFGSPTGNLINVDFDAGAAIAHAIGSIVLMGGFDDVDSFDALLASELAVAIGSGTPTACTGIEMEVQGTRA